jgi:hypothetical protein
VLRADRQSLAWLHLQLIGGLVARRLQGLEAAVGDVAASETQVSVQDSEPGVNGMNPRSLGSQMRSEPTALRVGLWERVWRDCWLVDSTCITHNIRNASNIDVNYEYNYNYDYYFLNSIVFLLNIIHYKTIF